ncbi:hypothetical protein [Pontibacter arcticus]|uniref:Uncharacterized protein n=1 Tax=Pontibacter arcticus TaxID=2080288 RepID=A0A364RBP2_9BACT|nr:hypothetical protein [Pontibacter arcticus]RAU81741.1 hypothetical protein DP923_13645 [Pontibacter arcticus]
MENFNLWFGGLIGFGYIYYMIAGRFSLKPKDQPFNNLFENSFFVKNLGLTVSIAIIGLWRISDDTRETLYFAPIIFLVTLRIADLISLFINDRHVIIATRWDNPPKGKKGINWIDRVLSFLIIFIPMISCGLIMNKLNFGVFIK